MLSHDTNANRLRDLKVETARVVTAYVEVEESVLSNTYKRSKALRKIVDDYYYFGITNKKGANNTSNTFASYEAFEDPINNVHDVDILLIRYAAKNISELHKAGTLSADEYTILSKHRWNVIQMIEPIIYKMLNTNYKFLLKDAETLNDYVPRIKEYLFNNLGTYNPKWRISTWLWHRIRHCVYKIANQQGYLIKYPVNNPNGNHFIPNDYFIDIDGGDTKGKDGNDTTVIIDSHIANLWRDEEIEELNSIQAKYDVDVDLIMETFLGCKAKGRYKAIFEMRFVDGYTLDKIGVAFNISRERVRQIEGIVINRLKFELDQYKRYKKDGGKFMGSIISRNKAVLEQIYVTGGYPNKRFVSEVASKLNIYLCNKGTTPKEIETIHNECDRVIQDRKLQPVVGLSLATIKHRLGISESTMSRAAAIAFPNGGKTVKNGDETNKLLNEIKKIEGNNLSARQRRLLDRYKYDPNAVVKNNADRSQTIQRGEPLGLPLEPATIKLTHKNEMITPEVVVPKDPPSSPKNIEVKHKDTELRCTVKDQNNEREKTDTVKGKQAKKNDSSKDAMEFIIKNSNGEFYCVAKVNKVSVCQVSLGDTGSIDVKAMFPCRFECVETIEDKQKEK